MGVEYYLVCIREGLLFGKGVESPRGRGRLSGVWETQLFLRSNQRKVIGWIIQILKYVDISCNGAKMHLVMFILKFLICVIDSIKGFCRCRG